MANLTYEQRQVVEFTGGNILVSASAGSGKTHTLTQKILTLICDQNIEISRILATTFTEASANDMKEKIRQTICKKIEEVCKTDKPLSDRLGEQLKDLATADISTIHSWCGRIIRNYFFVAGVSPDFRVIDVAEAGALKADAMSKTFREFYEKKGFFITLANRHGGRGKESEFKQLILDIYEFAAEEAYPEKFLKKHEQLFSPSAIENSVQRAGKTFFEKIKKLEEQAVVLTAEIEKINKGALLNFAKTLSVDLALAGKVKDVFEAKAKYGDYKLAGQVGNSKDQAFVENKNAIFKVKKEFVKLIDGVSRFSDSVEEEIRIASECKAHANGIAQAVTRFTEIYSELKREENALDYNDLQHFALKVLADKDAREEIKNKYDYIFVDEYQDTSGVQDEIISSLDNGNILMVGDVKQSIYSFRGCRPEFFVQKDKEMTTNGGKVVRLNRNFRSAKNVINAVNDIFNYCMTDKVYGEKYKGVCELAFNDGENGYPEKADGRFQLHCVMPKEKDKNKVEKPKEKPAVYDLLKETKEEPDDAAYQAALIKRIIDQELQKEYYDLKEGKYKKVGYGDIAILNSVKNGATVKEVTDILDMKYGVPITTVTAENVCNYAEIKVIINALRAIDCKKFDMPLASTLKSAIGGFTDEDLFEIASFYGDAVGKHGDHFYTAYQYYLNNAKTPLNARLRTFDEYFNELRLVADFLGAGGVINKLIRDKNLRAHILVGNDGEDKLRRLNYFISTTSVGGRALTVKEFLNRVDGAPKAFEMARSGGENTVTCMTIHASKGLEFPVVIVYGLEKHFNREDEKKEILMSRDKGLAPKYYDDIARISATNSVREAIKDEFQIQTVKERMRLFYVATTRAKYSLHLVYSGANSESADEFETSNNFMGFIPPNMPRKCYGQEELDLGNDGDDVKTVIASTPNDRVVAGLKERFEYIYPNLIDTVLPIKSSVTAANAVQKDEYYPVVQAFSEETTNTELGVNAHRILELFDFNRIEDFDGEIARMINSGALLKERLSGLNLERIASAVKGGAFDGLKDKQLYREKSFIVNVPSNMLFDDGNESEVLVQGVIDLLVIDGDTATIIDYKYSAHSEERLKRTYRKQLELYAYAVEKGLGLKVKDKIIVSLLTGETVKID